jgi:lipopolysaccharide transport protein LptA
MSSRSTRSFAFARGCTVALLMSLSPFMMGASKTAERPPQISFDAASSESDLKTHVMHLTDVTVTYGKMTVRADRALATASDFKDSRWTFNGNVRINAVPRGNLRSDEAVVEFEDNQLKRATATGNPAEFEQTREEDSNVIARGHADQIVYDVGPGTIRLSDNAWVDDGRDNMRAPVIVYNLRDERVEASTSSAGERVHVVIAPGEAPRADTNKTHPTQSDPGKPPSSASPRPPTPQTFAPQRSPNQPGGDGTLAEPGPDVIASAAQPSPPAR